MSQYFSRKPLTLFGILLYERNAALIISEAIRAPEVNEARGLIFAYADELRTTADIDLELEGFTEKMAHFPSPFSPPDGALILAHDDGKAVGCVALRSMEDGAGEIKRLYVVPEYRGEGVGIKLIMGAINAAHMRGFRTVCLDTLPHMGQAIAIYERLGFNEIGPYYLSPHPGTRYFRLQLNKV